MSCTCVDPATRSCVECRDYETYRRRQRLDARLSGASVPANLQALRFSDCHAAPAAMSAARSWALGYLRALWLQGGKDLERIPLVAAAVWERLQREQLQWVPAPRLMTELRSGLGTKIRERANKTITGSKGAVLLDLDQVNATEHTKEALFAIVNNRIAAGAPLLVSTSSSTQQVESRIGDVARALAEYCRAVTL